MINNFNVKISCGAYFTPALHAMEQGSKMDKEFHIDGDISLEDVQSLASRVAISAYAEKRDRLLTEDSGVMKDGVANAFIFSDDELVSAVSAYLEGKEPDVEIYDQQKLEEMLYSPTHTR